MRITLVTEIPAPYRLPIFNALAARPEVELDVLFLRERDPRRPDYRFDAESARFAWRILPGLHVERGGRWLILNGGLLRALRRSRADVFVVGGWAQPAYWQVLALAKLTRRPTLGWVESTSRDLRSGRRLLELAKRGFVAATDGVLVPGKASVEYVRELGASAERIGVAPNAVDFSLFRSRVDAARKGREGLRRRLGVDGVCLLSVGRLDPEKGREGLRKRLGVDGVCLLSVGRLDPEKGLDVLLEALAALPGARLLIAGDGGERRELEALAERLAPGRVRFLGFVQPAELADWYAAADVFVLPSRSEQWGMVLNEAGLAALPLVATDVAGAAHDLIEDEVNGFRVPAGDSGALARALGRLVADDELRAAAGRRSRELAEELTPERWAEAVAGLAHRLVG